MDALTRLQIANSHRFPLETFSAWLAEHEPHPADQHDQTEPGTDAPVERAA